MIRIANELTTIICDETGNSLILIDNKRGTRWQLDPQSLGYGDRHAVQGAYSDPQSKPGLLIANGAQSGKPSELVVTYLANQERLDIVYSLHRDYVEVRMPVPASAEIGFATLPGSFLPEGERMKLLLPIMQGMLWDGRGPELNAMRADGGHIGFSMSFVGFLAESGGLLITAESKDDCRWWFGKDSANRMWATNVQLASLGSMRYERVVRLYMTDADIVALAKQYRRKVFEQGRFITWDEKIAKRPALERIFGALMVYIGYCKDDVDYVEGCRKLQAYGFDRALLYPGRFNMYYPDIHMGGVPAIDLSRETIEAIKSLGYDMAPWSWLNEALPVSPEEVLRQYRRDPAGQIMPHWKIDDQQWYLICHSYLQDWQQKALTTIIPEMTWDHFDVLSCVAGLECHALDHPHHLGRPASRTEDRQWVREVFKVDLRAGRMVSSESFNDAYSLEYDFGSVKAFPLYGPWPFWPVPLTMLVYHDSLIHSWYELHSYNNQWRGRTTWPGGFFEYGGGRPRLMAALDALMGCPPDVFPFGAQYGYNGRGTDTFLYKYRFEDPEVQIALKEALPVARLHRRIGKQEMVHFKILSEDGYVQESAFADGTHVAANFSLDFVGSDKGIDHKIVPGAGVLPPEGWRVD